MLKLRQWIVMAATGLMLGGGLAAQEGSPAKGSFPATKLQPMQEPKAQDAAELQAKYQANYAKKLKKEFIAYGGWITDWDAARKKAKAEGKLLFSYFSRSYAP